MLARELRIACLQTAWPLSYQIVIYTTRCFVAVDLLQFIALCASISMAEAASIVRSSSLSHGLGGPLMVAAIDDGVTSSMSFVEWSFQFISDASASTVEMALACNW